MMRKSIRLNNKKIKVWYQFIGFKWHSWPHENQFQTGFPSNGLITFAMMHSVYLIMNESKKFININPNGRNWFHVVNRWIINWEIEFRLKMRSSKSQQIGWFCDTHLVVGGGFFMNKTKGRTNMKGSNWTKTASYF